MGFYAGIQKGDWVPDPHPLENHKAIGSLRNPGMDPLENHVARCLLGIGKIN